jgi:iron complex outermembrane receptor protein
LFNVKRMSFYKGPHGTSFGVPNSMGVFEVVTRAPGPELHGDASYKYGSYEFHELLAHVSGPILPNLFFGLDGMYSRDDGWFQDQLTGGDYGEHELASGRMRLRWLPTDCLEINFTLGLDRHDDDPPIYVPFDTTTDRYVLLTSPDAYSRGGQNYQALQAIWKGRDWQVKSITSRRDSDFDDDDDALLLDVFTPFTLQRSRQQDVTTWTQEIRAESTDPDALWRWRTGLFFSSRDSFLDHFILGTGPWEGANDLRYQHDDYAVYGELTRVVGDQLELTSGLRLQTTHDRTTSRYEPTAFAQSLGGAALSVDKSDNFNAALPMAAAAWKWTDTQRSYFRFSTGLQPGGLEIAAGASADYQSERSLHYEVGHDSSFDDRNVQLHVAAFYTDYYDYQSFQFNPAGQTIFNADRAHALGLEGEIRVRPCDGIELFAGAGYTYAKFDNFESPIGDFSGKRISNIPVGTVNVGGTWRATWGGMARVDWRYVGRTWFDEGNTVEQDGYSVVDVRVGYERDKYGVYLFANNLFDQEYYTHAYLFQGAPAATPGVPGIVGMEVKAAF